MKYIFGIYLAVSIASCSEKPLVPNINGGNSQSVKPQDPLDLVCSASKSGKSYTGLAGISLTVGRVGREEIPQDGNRLRVKPYNALVSEFNRVVGTTPQSLLDNPATFQDAPDRWFIEPASNAISLFATYRSAYESALYLVTLDQKYRTAPTNSSAQKECTEFAEKAWDRKPSSSEVQACIDIAMEGSAQEVDPSKRWAYTLASILTATGFIAY